jgi:hypothetical protein
MFISFFHKLICCELYVSTIAFHGISGNFSTSLEMQLKLKRIISKKVNRFFIAINLKLILPQKKVIKNNSATNFRQSGLWVG